MRIFISHSKQDRWVAKRISQDLTERGVSTFLDEKDIETGASIHGAIQDNLGKCDEALLVLSPLALKSDWVLMEIGGAKALGKRLVPILHHIGANDLPDALRDELARDLNEIDTYYDEVVKRAAEETPGPSQPHAAEEEAPTEPPAQPSAKKPRYIFKAGDPAYVPEQPQPSAQLPNGMIIGWNDAMTPYAGKMATVVYVDPNNAVRLDVDGGKWWWAQDWLEPAGG